MPARSAGGLLDLWLLLFFFFRFGHTCVDSPSMKPATHTLSPPDDDRLRWNGNTCSNAVSIHPSLPQCPFDLAACAEEVALVSGMYDRLARQVFRLALN